MKGPLQARELVPWVAAAAATLLVSALLVSLAGASPLAALLALAEGSLLSPFALGETLTRSTGLVLTALAAVLALRAGVLNVGLEGQLLMGATAAAAVGPVLSGAPLLARVALLVAAALAGAATALPALWLLERRRVPAVLSTILLNLVAASVVAWLVRGPLRDGAADYPQSAALDEAVKLGPLVEGMRGTAAVLFSLLVAGALFVFLSRTRPGLELRAVGASPEAARAAGLPDLRIRSFAFLGSGALAGLAGGLEVLAVTGRLYDPFSAGVGYTGIAAALLGGLHPLGATAAALVLAAFGAGGGAMQRDAGVPAALATLVPALAVLAVLAVRARRERGSA